MKPKWPKKLLKRRPRIYILPTRMGGYLNGLIFLMFLLAVGYNNNLLLIFTLFLFGLNLIWVIQTHYHLHSLKAPAVSISDGHAEEKSLIKVLWTKSPEGPVEWSLTLENEDHSFPVASLENTSSLSLGEVVLPKRGLWKFQHLKVKTERPFGLYKVWIYFPIESEAFAYPRKLKVIPPLSFENLKKEGGESQLVKGSEEFSGLAAYAEEESRKISWKHYARTGELVVKEGEDTTTSSVIFKIPLGPENKEVLLSKIATQMVFCSSSQIPFSLITQEKKFSFDHGPLHLGRCLRELSIC